MENNNSVTTPLLDRGSSKDSSCTETVFVKPTRCLIIEPFIVLVTFGLSCYGFVMNLYVYNAIAKHYGIDWLKQTRDASPCSGNMTANETDTNNQIQKSATYILTMLNMSVMIPALFSGLLLTSYSDVTGRRFPLTISTFGLFLQSVLFIIVAELDLSVYWLLLGHVASGVLGSTLTTIQISSLYLMDIHPPEKRTLRLLILQVSAGIGSFVPPLVLGFWVYKQGFLPAIILGTCVLFLALMYVILFVPESIEKISGERLISLEPLKRPFRLYFGNISNEESVDSRRGYLLIPSLLMIFVGFQISTVFGSIRELFLINKPLCWNSEQIGVYFAVAGLISFGGSVGVLRLLQLCGLKDRSLLVISITTSIASYAVFSIAIKDWIVYLATVLGILNYAIMGTLNSMLSQTVSSEVLGALFSVNGVIEKVFTLVGTMGLSSIYAASEGFWPGLMYAVLACSQIIALFLGGLYSWRFPRYRLADE